MSPTTTTRYEIAFRGSGAIVWGFAHLPAREFEKHNDAAALFLHRGEEEEIQFQEQVRSKIQFWNEPARP